MFKEQLDNILRMSEEVDRSYELYQMKNKALTEAKKLLEMEMQATEVDSIRVDSVRATIARRKSLVVTDERKLIKWLHNNPELETNVYIGVKRQAIEPIVKAYLAKTDKQVPGTELKTTEYLSIRNTREEK